MQVYYSEEIRQLTGRVSFSQLRKVVIYATNISGRYTGTVPRQHAARLHAVRASGLSSIVNNLFSFVDHFSH